MARELINDLGFSAPRDENTHRFVLIHLGNAGEIVAIEAATLMADLHERRKRADYDLSDARYENEAFAADTIARADRAVRLLEACRREPARTSIQGGIAAYRSKIGAPEPRT